MSQDILRPITITPSVNKYAEGSALIKVGDTHIICTATVDHTLPRWLKGQGKGWITAEYGMLPRSTGTRMDRESIKGQSGRTQEIQRLIGRALRAVVDLDALGETVIKIDCDVIQADGGTRTASITGAYVAMYQALKRIGRLDVLKDSVAAVSCGIVGGEKCLDLDYEKDSSADTDANFVITGSGKIIEIQGTAERDSFSESDFFDLLSMAKRGIEQIKVIQQEAINGIE